MRLRVLWRIARHHFDSVSLPTRTLLTLAAPPSLQQQHVLLALAGAGGLVTETQSDLGTLNADLLEVRASRALAAALLLDPLYLLVDLAVAHGQAATAPALALSLSLCVGQALVASAALHQRTAEGWRQALLALSDELAAEMRAAGDGSAPPAMLMAKIKGFPWWPAQEGSGFRVTVAFPAPPCRRFLCFPRVTVFGLGL